MRPFEKVRDNPDTTALDLTVSPRPNSEYSVESISGAEDFRYATERPPAARLPLITSGSSSAIPEATARLVNMVNSSKLGEMYGPLPSLQDTTANYADSEAETEIDFGNQDPLPS